MSQHGRPQGEYSLVRGISTEHVVLHLTLICVVASAKIFWNSGMAVRYSRTATRKRPLDRMCTKNPRELRRG